MLRVLWAIPFNGADLREALTVVPSIRERDFDSWYAAWSSLAIAVAQRGSALVDPVSHGKAALRSSSYMRTAEFFLEGHDPRRSESAAFTRERFYDGLDALNVDFTCSRVSYDGVGMETLFLRSPVAECDDVLVVHGGFDSTPEELYFMIGAGALERGFHVLIWEGPGQGNLLREFGRPFVADWERPAGAALDSLGEHCRPRAVIGVGISLGGHLLARAAAHMPRYHGIVMFDFFPGVGDAFADRVPQLLRAAFLRMPAWLAALVRLYARYDRELAWAIANGEWTFGAHGIRELVAQAHEFDDREWAGRIDTHVLALVGENEHFFDRRLAHDFQARLTSAR
jgi:alpha-beta hydrolase superfamily lysophospholipase